MNTTDNEKIYLQTKFADAHEVYSLAQKANEATCMIINKVYFCPDEFHNLYDRFNEKYQEFIEALEEYHNYFQDNHDKFIKQPSEGEKGEGQ